MHWSRVNDVLKQAGSVSGKVIVSCSMPMTKDDSELAIAHTSSGAEALAKKVRRGRAWCTAETTKAKQVAARLIRDVGFDPIDAGPLRTARYMEPFTMLVAQLAYEGRSGPQVASIDSNGSRHTSPRTDDFAVQHSEPAIVCRRPRSPGVGHAGEFLWRRTAVANRLLRDR